MALRRGWGDGRSVLKLVGLGLGPPDYLTLKALSALESSRIVYLDTYTSSVPPELVKFLAGRLGARLRLAGRRDLEEGVRAILDEASVGEVSIAVPGDPMIATTHVAVLQEAVKRGVDFEVIHGVSALSAAISTSHLSSYRFGRVVTIPKQSSAESLSTIYRRIAENLQAGLHTLVLLDVAGSGMLASEACAELLKVAEKEGGPLYADSPVIVLARIGYPDAFRAVCRLSEAPRLNLPPPPHALVIPSQLQPYEAEALERLLRAPPDLVFSARRIPTRWGRVERYVEKTARALEGLTVRDRSGEVERALETARSYIEDARYFVERERVDDAMLAISYAEGILDCLKILGKVEFSW